MGWLKFITRKKMKNKFEKLKQTQRAHLCADKHKSSWAETGGIN